MLPEPISAFFKSGRLDSNQRPLRPERSALPGCATARKKGNHFCEMTTPSC